MYITIEGGDGAGKGTVHKAISQYFKDKGIETYDCIEPGNEEDLVCQGLRKLITEAKYAKTHPLCEHYMFMADRAQNVAYYVLPHLKEGCVVIQDRGRDSTDAYQIFGNGGDFDMIRKNQVDATQNVWPDLTIFIDVPPEVGLERTKKDQSRKDETFDETKFEDRGLGFQERVYAGYCQLADEFPDRIKVVNGNQDPKTVAQEVYCILDSYYIKWGSFRCQYLEGDWPPITENEVNEAGIFTEPHPEIIGEDKGIMQFPKITTSG